MEDLYWLGYKIALGLVILGIIIGRSYQYSIRAKNLEKVGLFYNSFQGRFVKGQKPSTIGQITGVLFSLLINPFLSWVSVIYYVYLYGNLIYQKLSTPEKLKEIQYRLGFSILTKEQVKELVKQSEDFLGTSLELEEDEEESSKLVIEDGDWYRDIEIEGNKIYLNHHPADYLSNFSSIYEYKVEGVKVYRRLLEKKIDHAGYKTYYDVKDGIVLENEILKRYENDKNSMPVILQDSEEQIKKLEKECERNEILRYYEVKYLILFKSKCLTKIELTIYLGKELKRIKELLLKTQELSNRYNLKLEYNEEYKYCEFVSLNPKEKNTQEVENFNKELDNLLEEINCEMWEIEGSEDIIATLQYYLDELNGGIKKILNC